MSSSLYIDATPDEVKNAKVRKSETPQNFGQSSENYNTHSTVQGLHLLTNNTPNGQRTQIMLEELKELYGTAFTTTLVNLKAGEQKTEWFLRLNPNGPLLHSLLFP